MRRLLSLGLCASLVVLGTVACGGDLKSLETSPTQTITESFTGTLNPNGGTTHAFVATGKGAVVATLTAIGDDNTIATLPLAATVTAAGQLCARVYDSKGVPDATTYTLQVIHP